MAKTKTFKTDQDVTEFINSIVDEKKRTDSFKLIEIMSGVTGFKPYMWGPSIIGFGNYHYKYQSGHEGDAPLTGFSPRKSAISLYMSSMFPEREELLKQLGKYRSAVACIYIKKLDDINMSILKKMIRASARHTKKNYPN
jgi:Domain of unknown function (DU1801)